MQKVYGALTEQEAKILDVKYQGKRIKDLPEAEIALYTEGLLTRIHIITGWKLPENEMLLTALNHEFCLQIKSRYRELTIEEITFAMREYGVAVKDWGKYANLSLIDEPIQEYLAARKSVSKIEEQHRPEEPKELPPEGVDWSDTWEMIKSGDLRQFNPDLIPWASIYDWVVKTGLLCPTNDEKWGWIKQRRLDVIREVAFKKEAFCATQEEKELAEMLKVPTWHKNERAVNHLISGSKRIGLELFIQSLNKAAHENID